MPKNVKRLLFSAAIVFVSSSFAFAQWDVSERPEDSGVMDSFKKDSFDLKATTSSGVEMTADQVQYDASTSQASASGNVVIKSGPTTLYADKVILDRTRQEAKAQGKIFIDSPDFQVDADGGTFNLQDKTGSFENARIIQAPLALNGSSVAKVSENHMVMENGYLTTCDHDVPHWRMQTKTMDVYPGDKAVARGIKFYIGGMPFIYMPRFTQDLKNKPWFTIRPGYKKDLGAFLLTSARFKINDDVTTTMKVDFYERQGIGIGNDTKYSTPNFGAGLLRTYYIHERSIAAKRIWDAKPGPTTVTDRYRFEWRHKWDVDERTSAIWQYYRLSDNVILKKYFEREYRQEPNADTYFLLTRALDKGTLSFRVDHRVNRFVSTVERHPEVRYEVSSLKLGESNVYLKNNTSYSNLSLRDASPSDGRKETQRVDFDNELSYPTRVGFVHVTPMVGGQTTYYSRTPDPRHPRDVVRGQFKTGADLSTRFMKVMNVRKNVLGIKVDKLRHIVAPSIAYRYKYEPSFQPSRLNQFDTAIDGLDKQHVIGLALENKLQTKRGKETFDLVRLLTTADYTLKQRDGIKNRLGPVKNLLEITPYEWLRMVSETYYDTHKDRLDEANFDMYFRKDNKFGVGIGDRYVRGGDHETVLQTAYVINPKWRIRTYNRFNFDTGEIRENGYTLIRDLHEWETGLNFNSVKGGGISFLMTFSLKAFPDQPLDLFGTTFHERKAGSQTSTTGF